MALLDVSKLIILEKLKRMKDFIYKVESLVMSH